MPWYDTGFSLYELRVEEAGMIHMVLELETSVWSYVWLNMDIDRFMHVHRLNKHIPSSSDCFRGPRTHIFISNSIFKQKEIGILGEMSDSRTGARNISMKNRVVLERMQVLKAIHKRGYQSNAGVN